jgi:polyphosphate glucokinase
MVNRNRIRLNALSNCPNEVSTLLLGLTSNRWTHVDILGIDIGGTGIKAAIVDTSTGALKSERHRIRTPESATPQAVSAVVIEMMHHFKWNGPIGCTLPARVEHGIVHTAANIHADWIETEVDSLFSIATGQKVTVLNDADAAGLASVTFGAGKGRMGTVFFITVGTGIGSAMFLDGKLVPGTELGHLQLKGRSAELYASARVKKEKELTWKKWAKRFQKYLHMLEFLFAPDAIIVGGGVSRPAKIREYAKYLNTNAELLFATLENEAGIIGAACAAAVNDQN